MIPTLEDVAHITSLRVFSRPVTGYTFSDYAHIAIDLLSFCPPHLDDEGVLTLTCRECLDMVGFSEAPMVSGEDSSEYEDRLIR